MPADTIGFNQDKFVEGQAAYARGIGLDVLVRQLNVESQSPEPMPDFDGTPATNARRDKWQADQYQREKNCMGIAFGYANGFLQAIRRIDQQLMGQSE